MITISETHIAGHLCRRLRHQFHQFRHHHVSLVSVVVMHHRGLFYVALRALPMLEVMQSHPHRRLIHQIQDHRYLTSLALLDGLMQAFRSAAKSRPNHHINGARVHAVVRVAVVAIARAVAVAIAVVPDPNDALEAMADDLFLGEDHTQIVRVPDREAQIHGVGAGAVVTAHALETTEVAVINKHVAAIEIFAPIAGDVDSAGVGGSAITASAAAHEIVIDQIVVAVVIVVVPITDVVIENHRRHPLQSIMGIMRIS